MDHSPNSPAAPNNRREPNLHTNFGPISGRQLLAAMELLSQEEPYSALRERLKLESRDFYFAQLVREIRSQTSFDETANILCEVALGVMRMGDQVVNACSGGPTQMMRQLAYFVGVDEPITDHTVYFARHFFMLLGELGYDDICRRQIETKIIDQLEQELDGLIAANRLKGGRNV